MRVSVVITSYDYVAYVGEAIESALAQTHADTEVIVVDDGSTDGSREVIERYADVVRVVAKSNGGQASAINAGFAVSSGDAILFLDADDALRPQAAERVAAAMSGGVSKAHWPLEVVDHRGEPVGVRWPDGALPDGDLSSRLLMCPDYKTPPTSGNAYARAMLEDVLPMPEAEFVTGADTYLFMLAPAFGEIRAFDEPLGTYRRHGENNYSSRPFDERIAQLRGWFDITLDALERHCAARGVPADPAAWRRTAWVYRVTEAARRLDEVIPQRTPFVLVDDGDWSMSADERRSPIPFLENGGAWWGPPADDAEAIAALARLRDDGARYLVFAFPAFWWLEHYTGFADHVASSCEQVAATDDLLIYALAGAA
jgi:glycosyltransferase involved in cell wall biosynthesis